MSGIDIKQLIDIESENALLGSLIINPELINFVELSGDEFFEQKNKVLYKTIRKLNDSGKDVDVHTIWTELENSKQVAGWDKAKIYALASFIGSSMHYETYAAAITDKYRRRNVVSMSTKLQMSALDTSKPLAESMSDTIFRLTENAAEKNQTLGIDELLDDFEEDMIARAMGEIPVGLKSGYENLDKITDGFERGNVVLLLGVPSVGKSMFAMQMAVQMASHSPGVIYSMEMINNSVVRRIIAGRAKLPWDAIKSGRFTADEKARYDKCTDDLHKLKGKLFSNDCSNWNLLSLRADLMRQKARHGIKWFVLDYMYLMRDMAEESETVRTTYISAGVKNICKSLGLVGIVVHSLNKTGMAKKDEVPGLSDIRGSGTIGYDADVVMGLTQAPGDLPGLEYLSEAQLANIKALWIIKGREIVNPRGCVLFTKQPDYPVFDAFETEPVGQNGCRHEPGGGRDGTKIG